MSEQAQILDRGYRQYDGERTGVTGAMTTVTLQGFRSVLGLGRPAKSKILPLVVAVIAYLPAVVFVGIAALFGDVFDVSEVADYSGYYAFIVFSLVLFASFVAPEALTSDRRNGLLPLYLSTPLTRTTYVISKYVAVLAAMCIVTIGPPLLQLIGYSFQGIGPDGIDGWFKILGQVLVSGLMVAAVFTGIAFAIAALTDRRAWASIGIVLVLLISSAVTAFVVEHADVSANLYLANLIAASFELVIRIYGEPAQLDTLSTGALAAVNAAWAFGGLGLAWLRYRTLEVSR